MGQNTLPVANPLKPRPVRPEVRRSLFTVVDEYDPPVPGVSRLEEVLALAQAAESAGIDTFWVAEHHFHSGGVCPSPPILLAAIAARTRRLRVGALVSVLPFHAPILLAEEYALIDRLSNGRLSIGVGSGYIPLELSGFGLDAATKRERFDRGLLTLRAALLGEEVRAEVPGASPVRLNVRPVQLPFPPIRVAVQRHEALQEMGRRGYPVALIPYATVADLGALAEEIHGYRAALPAGAVGDVAAAVHVYAGPHPERARAALQRYLDSRLMTQSVNYLDRVRADPTLARAETLEQRGFALFGSADEVLERLREFERAGVDELLAIVDFGALPSGEALRTVRALAPPAP